MEDPAFGETWQGSVPGTTVVTRSVECPVCHRQVELRRRTVTDASGDRWPHDYDVLSDDHEVGIAHILGEVEPDIFVRRCHAASTPGSIGARLVVGRRTGGYSLTGDNKKVAKELLDELMNAVKHGVPDQIETAQDDGVVIEYVCDNMRTAIAALVNRVPPG